jgi:hypothetical protein
VRENANSQFSDILKSCSKLAKEIFGSEIQVPRVIGEQMRRSNPPSSSPEEYFRRSIFLPCLDDLISGLKERFSVNKDILSSLEILLPKNADERKLQDLSNIEFYWVTFVSEPVIKAEYSLWCEKWRAEPNKPLDIMDVLDACDPAFFPSISKLLRIFACLPVSTASVERSFSSLKRIKSYLRNKMGGERLTGLALLSIHSQLSPDVDKVIDVMGSSGERKALLELHYYLIFLVTLNIRELPETSSAFKYFFLHFYSIIFL